ncbi:TPA: hypothetical protein NV830_001065 [Escherichia coli]|nr:hypothetical protein [Escherichia coli]HCJ8922295.1 hypothetical protein [Escherichia coli]
MYKVTIIQSVGNIRKEVILETEDVNLVREIVLKEDNLQAVESDAPNLMVDQEYSELRRIFEEIQKKETQPTIKPFGPYDPSNPSSPWIMRNTEPYTPFEITC